MMPLKAYLDALSPLKPETWEAVAPLFQPVLLPKNAHYIRDQETATTLAFLETGIVRAYFVNQQGQEYNKQFFVAPSLIGAYTSLLTAQPNRIPQQALSDCVIWSAPYAALTRLYDTFPDLERLSRKIAEHYFLEKERKELEIVLLDATARYHLFQQEFPGIEQMIPQYHVASYLGITPIQLSRIRHPQSGK